MTARISAADTSDAPAAAPACASAPASAGADTVSREEALLRRARQRRAVARGSDGGTARPDAAAPLSHAQHRMWLMDRLGQDATAYHVPYATRLRGPLEVEALGRALQALTQRHQVLRTRYAERDGEPVQEVVEPAPACPPRVVQEAAPATETLRAEAARPFDLAAGPLPRALVVRHGHEDHTVLLTFHHIAVDGGSMAVIGRDLAELYEAECAGRAPVLAAKVPQYADFARRERARTTELESGLEHWLTRLAGARPVPLPAPPRVATPPRTPAGGAVLLAEPLPDGVPAGLRRMGTHHRTTPFAVVFAAACAALLRTTGGEDLVLGCAADHREGTRMRDLVGLCVNTLPLRVHTDGAEDFGTLLERVRGELLDGLENRDVPLDLIVERLGGAARTSGGTPLLNVTADLLSPPAPLRLPGTRGEAVAVDLGVPKFGLTLAVEEPEAPDGVARCLAQYDAAVLDPEAARRILDAFAAVLRAVAAAEPGRPPALERPPAAPDAAPSSAPYGAEPHPALALLRERPEVAAAFLVEREGQPPLAFAVPEPAAVRGASPTQLRSVLRSRLEPALVPERVTLVDALPRTPGGGVDHARLPGFDIPAGTRAPLTGAHARAVLAAFAELLGEEPGPDGDFFLLGGHSLLAVQLAERLRRQLRLPLTGLDVMEHRSPRGLAALLDERARERRERAAGPPSAAYGAPVPTAPALAKPVATAPAPSRRSTVLVTGATGGVGTFAVRELSARGHAVRALARPESAHLAEPGVRVVEGDLRDTEGLRRAAAEADAIVHAACTFTDHEADLAAMRALVDGWRRGPFVFVSSTDADGEPETLSAYGRAKLDCERMLLDAASVEGPDAGPGEERGQASVVRTPIVWGDHPRFRDQLRWGATGEFYQAVRSGGSVALPGPDAGWYGAPWVHAAALARVLARCLERPAGGVVNAVSGHVAWADFAEELGRLMEEDAGRPTLRVTPLEGVSDPRHGHRYPPEASLAEELALRPGEDWRAVLRELLAA